MRLSFLGAAGEVTGSCFLVDTGEIRFLVDCGMFQGGHLARAKNRRFAFEPREIAFVLLTHAHIDHSGLLPRLVAGGFKGAIYATPGTCDLAGVMLPDSGHLQEKEAEWSREKPLYSVAEAQASLRHLVPVDYGSELRPHPKLRASFRDAGHILGSAIVELRAGGAVLVFSGDLGQPGHPLMRAPTPIAHADVLLVESTYGNRDHKSLAQTMDEFAFALNDTLASRRGNVVIPAFAVGRTQDVLYFISRLQAEKRLPAMDVYVDSPMALAATRITLRYLALPEVERVHFVEDVEESKRLHAIGSGAVFISASGMCDGGRIRHHLRANLPRRECAIVFTGFQAAGTLGRRIVDGAKSVRLLGEACPVRSKVFTIGGLSAHADQSALLGWLSGFEQPPGQTWIVHGEPLAAQGLRAAIHQRLGWTAGVAAPLASCDFGTRTVAA
jgi:metallo-beta-lactamase family protein